MVLQNWIFPLLIGIVSAYLLLSILYNNYPHIRQKFSDLGALIQLQTSRPYYYTNWVPENQSVYNNVVKSYGMQPSDMMVGTRELNKGYSMVYPITYLEQYNLNVNSNSNPNSLLANPHVKINNI